MAKYNYRCDFCNSGFVTEVRFLKHECDAMRRDKDFRSTTGKAAWIHYQNWMKSNRRSVPAPDSFIQSRFFNTFIKFAKFAKKVSIPNVDGYIRLMSKRNISPTLWSHDQVYMMYLEHMEYNEDPMKLAEITIEALYEIADDNAVDIGNVFDVALPSEIIQMIRQRRLSPWILLKSPKFRDFFMKKASGQEQIIMQTIIKHTFWGKRFGENPDTVKSMVKLVTQLNL